MQIDQARIAADRRQLNDYRLLRDLTYPQLAEEMRRFAIPMSDRTVHDFLTKQRAPRGRTLCAVRAFLAIVTQERTTRRSLQAIRRLITGIRHHQEQQRRSA